MKGIYNGCTMRAFKLVPGPVLRAAHLSKDALKRLEWIDWYENHKKNVSLTCRHFGISRDTFYLWLKRFNRWDLATLEFDPKTRRPHKLREMTTSPEVQNKIYHIRAADPEKSKYEIHEELKRKGILVAHNVIQKVINRHTELINSQHKRRIKKHKNRTIARLKAARELREKNLGSLVQIDTKYFYVLGRKFYLFSAVDCKSRYGFTYCYKTISSLSGKDFVRRVKEYFPFPIQAVNTDNGSEYLLEFHKELVSWGIPHYFTDPHCPKQNGRVERFHQTVEYEYFNYQEDLLDDLSMINSRCMEFNEKYNSRRFHQSLGYKTPGEYVSIQLQIQQSSTVRYV
jgi:transposase InsO family protein